MNWQNLDDWPNKTTYRMNEIAYRVREAERIGKSREGSITIFYWAAMYNHFNWHLREVKSILTLWGDDE